MERVGVLIDKLRQQLTQKADVQNMLVTAQLLHSELLLLVGKMNGSESKKVSVMAPNAAIITPESLIANTDTDLASYKPVTKPEPEPEPIPEPIVEPETPPAEPAAVRPPVPEPEPIPHFVEQNAWQSIFPAREEKKSGWSVDPALEVPTLAHQEKVFYELNDTISVDSSSSSLNERLKQHNAEVSSLLQEAPIRDLKKAISINDRHRFIHELFRGDETMYERSMKTINSFHIFAEAEYWIQRELKVKLGWDTTLDLVKTFDQLVKRRFA